MTGLEKKRGLPRITFDTNVCNVIHEPGKRPRDVDPADAGAVRSALCAGRIRGYVAGAALFVECLSFADKLRYLAIAGTRAARPSPAEAMVRMYRDLAGLGIQRLQGALIMGEDLITDVLPPAPDEIWDQAERQKRFGDFVEPYPRHHPLIDYGKGLLAAGLQLPPPALRDEGPLLDDKGNRWEREMSQKWARALLAEWEIRTIQERKAFRNKVGDIVAEWCDVLIVGAHHAYGNDVFCTQDRGKNGGPTSILHTRNRDKLAAQGIRIMTARELVVAYGL